MFVHVSGDLLKEYQASPHLKGMNMPDVQHHMQHMRHLTFKRLTEQGNGTRPAGAAAGATGSRQPMVMTDIPLDSVQMDQVTSSGAGARGSGSSSFGGAVELGNMKGIV